MATDTPPLKGASFQVAWPFYDGSGCLVGAGGGLAACISQDFGAMVAAACTITELNSGAGIYTLKFSASEMDANVLAWKAVSTSASARPAVGVIYTAASRQLKDLAWPTVAGRSLDVDANGGVEVGSFQASAVTTCAFTAGAIDAAAIAASTLTNAKFGATFLTNSLIAASTITASTFQAGAIDGVAIADSAIDAATLAASTLTACKFGAGAIDAAAIADSAIDAGALAASTITACKIAANAIDSSHVAASTLTNAKFGASALTAGVIAGSALTVAELADSAASRIGTIVRTGCAMNELGVGAPPASPTLEQAMLALYMTWRNSGSTTSGCIQVTNDAGTVVFKATVSDNASIFAKEEFVSG